MVFQKRKRCVHLEIIHRYLVTKTAKQRVGARWQPKRRWLTLAINISTKNSRILMKKQVKFFYKFSAQAHTILKDRKILYSGI